MPRSPHTVKSKARPAQMPGSELLICPDGRILAHNLTPALARVLAPLNPGDATMNRRAQPEKNFPT